MRTGILLVAFALVAVSAPARAACDRSVPALSEARAARWLIGDDVRMQALLDVERERLRHAARLVDQPQPFHLFAAGHGAYQRVFGIEACSQTGERSGSLERPRGAGTVGFTHTASGLHARLSFLYAGDVISVAGIPVKSGDEVTSSDATAGYRQGLVALRLGHEQYFQSLFGYVSAEQPYRTTGSGGARINPRLPISPSPGFFFGGTIPMLHTSIVTLLQAGRPEIISLVANELRPGRLPFSVSLGPTYIREERQVVGLLRLRGFSYENHATPRDAFTTTGEGTKRRHVHGVGETYEATGPILEVSAETREPRLRHARARWQLVHAWRFASRRDWAERTAFDVLLFADGTLFRSRAFTESRESLPPSALPMQRGPRRGNAWGFGAGGAVSVQAGWLAFSVESAIGMNRPELLQIVPSAAHRAELQLGGSMRAEY